MVIIIIVWSSLSIIIVLSSLSSLYGHCMVIIVWLLYGNDHCYCMVIIIVWLSLLYGYHQCIISVSSVYDDGHCMVVM